MFASSVLGFEMRLVAKTRLADRCGQPYNIMAHIVIVFGDVSQTPQSSLYLRLHLQAASAGFYAVL